MLAFVVAIGLLACSEPMPPAPSTSLKSTTSATTATTVPPTVAQGTPKPSPGSTIGDEPDSGLEESVVLFGPNGVTTIDPTGDTVSITSTSSVLALAVGSLILTQGPDELRPSDVYPPWKGWVVEVYGKEHEPELIGVSNRQLQLWDARVIDGKPVALMTMINWQEIETYEELLLVDVDPEPTGDPGDMFTSLGRVGSYENLVIGARFAGDDLIVLSTPESGFEARTLAGDSVWTGVQDRHDSPFVIADGELWVLTPWFDQPDFTPVLDIQRRSLTNGRELIPSTAVEIDAEFDGGFCLRVDWDGEHILCDETYGPPFAFDIDTGAIVTVFESADQGSGLTVVR